MSKLESKNKRKQFKIEDHALRNIFNEWQPVGFTSPEDEYDCLVHNMLSVLHAGGEKRDIAARIKKEIEHHFGMGSIQAKEIESVTNKIWEWWKSRIK